MTEETTSALGAVREAAENTQPPELIPEHEAARLLGVSPGTLKAARLHRLKSNPLRDLPYVKIGRRILRRRSDIAAWIEANTVRGAA